MVYVNPMWQNIIDAAFAITFVGGALVLFVRAYLVQRTYLRHFADEYPWLASEALFPIPPTFEAYRIGWVLLRERQADPELERLRRAIRRRNRLFILWIPAFPIVFWGMEALLIATGVVTLTSAQQPPPSGLQGITLSRSVLEILQMVAFVCWLVGSLLANAQYGRLLRMLGAAFGLGWLGFFAVLAGTVPQGPAFPLLLFVVGFIIAGLTPRVSRVGKLTANQLRLIGYLLGTLSILAQFVVEFVGYKSV